MSVSELGPQSVSVPTERSPRRAPFQVLDAVPAPTPVLPLQDEAAISLLGYWQTLVKHRIAIGAVFVAALVVGAVVTLLMPPVYTATSTIQIDREPPKVMNVQQVDSPDLFSSEEFYQTQYGLLRSKSLALRMVRALGLDLNPAYLAGGRGLSSLLGGAAPPLKAVTPGQRAAAQKRALRIFARNLSVTPVRGSHLVKISYSNPNPLLAAQIANGTADNFITANLERRYEASSYARDFLQSRLAQVKQKLEDSEKQLAEYATQQRIINLPGPVQGANEVTQSPTANSLVSLNTALSEATAQRIRAEQEWRQAQSASGDLPQVLSNPTIQALTQARAGLQATYQDKLNLYRPNFPSMVQLHAQIAELDRQINAETSSIRNALRAQYQTSLNQERALSGRVEGLKASMLDLNDRSIQYNILQREVDTNRTLYDGLLQRYKEIGVTGGIGINNIAVIDRADTPDHPSQPKPLTNMALAALAGLVLGAIVAFILEAFDQSVRTPEDVEEKLGLPLLGAAPLLLKGQAPAAALADTKSSLSEAYFSIRTALQFTTAEGVPASLFVTSFQPAEGKSTSAQALAQNFARIGARVLLVDADLRNPSLHRAFALDNFVGLSNFLTGASGLKDIVQPSGTPGLSIVPCGPLPPSPAELLAGGRLKMFLAQAKADYDVVIVDGPPIMGLADAPILASETEGTVLVVEAGRTRRGAARAAIRRLQAANARLLGIVLTKFDQKRATYGYGYDYAYGHDYGRRIGTVK